MEQYSPSVAQAESQAATASNVVDQLPEEAAPQSSWKPLIREVVETLVLTLIIFFLIRTVVQNFRVDGTSMEPNFQDGQFLLINKLSYKLGEPRRGDVVVFHYPRDPSRDFIKRIVGLPGETVEVREGQVFINGELVPSIAEVRPAYFSTNPLNLQADEVYVLGDNRPSSQDSQEWGPLPMDLVLGKVLLSYWPPETWGLVSAAAGETPAALPAQ